MHSPYKPLAILLGVLLFVLGSGLGLYHAVAASGAETTGVFSRPNIDFVPILHLDNVTCPGILTQGESRTVSTTLPNRSDAPKAYTVSIEARQTAGASHSLADSVIVEGPASAQAAMHWGRQVFQTTGTIPPNGSVRINWRLRVEERLGQAIVVDLYTNIGNSLYEDSCGIALSPISSLSGRQLLLLILMSMPAGGVLWLYGRWPLGCSGYAASIAGVLLWALIALILT